MAAKNGIKKVVTMVSDYAPGIDAETSFKDAFTKEGGEAYLKDLPQAEIHRLDSGHFAAEDSGDVIAEAMIAFHQKKVH